MNSFEDTERAQWLAHSSYLHAKRILDAYDAGQTPPSKYTYSQGRDSARLAVRRYRRLEMWAEADAAQHVHTRLTALAHYA